MRPPLRPRKPPKRYRLSASPSLIPTTGYQPARYQPIPLATRGGQGDDEDDLDVETEQPHELWKSAVSWDELTDGIKIIILSEVKHAIGFQEALDFLQLEDGAFNDLLDICSKESRFNHEELARIERGNVAQRELMMNGCYDKDELSAAFAKEAFIQPFWRPSTMFINSGQIRQAKLYLVQFNCREDFRLEEIKPGESSPLTEERNRRINNLPTCQQIIELCKGLDGYHGTNMAFHQLTFGDVDFEVGEESGKENTVQGSDLGVENALDDLAIDGPGLSMGGLHGDGERQKKRKNHRGREQKKRPSGLRNAISVNELESPT
jgi:hypothetical protein